MSDSHPDHRGSYRVRYPLGYPAQLIPHVVIEPDQHVDLEDLSEQGLRVKLPQSSTYAVGDTVRIRITMPDEEPIAAEGTIVWLDEHFAAIHFASLALPWRILLNAQRSIARWRTRLVEVNEERGGNSR